MSGLTRAVLFDFGGTLYDYRSLAAGEAESLAALAEWTGVDADMDTLRQAHRAALREVYHAYLPRRFYLHRDLFGDALARTLEGFGRSADADLLERHRRLQRELHRRDFQLREGVLATLAALRGRGLHVGMVSNIDQDQLLHLIDAAGLAPHFDAVLSSETAGACKPDPAIFAAALCRASCRADEVLFVGDTLAQDIAGANRAGMRSALLWHRDDRPPPAGDVRPTHVIRHIPELLALL
ncbi:MAG: HAD family hydrolase [Candidatus Binatia bacterium]